MKRIAVIITAVTGLVFGLGAAPASAFRTPPTDAVSVNVKTTCTGNGSYMAIRSNPKVRWTRAPKRKGLTVGHYMRVKAQIMTSAGYNGTLWKPLATEKYKTKTFYLPSKGLPVTVNVPVAYNARYGTLNYRTKVTVRVIRNVKPGLDTTAWKGVYWEQSDALCWSPGTA